MDCEKLGDQGEVLETLTISCNFLFFCSGYYKYEEGYTPDFVGIERYPGTVVHPQKWPEDLNYAGKRIVVIGSGATAITLVPNLAKTAAHVTMLQRSPSYVFSLPRQDPFIHAVRFLPKKAAYRVLRWKNIGLQFVATSGRAKILKKPRRFLWARFEEL